MKSFLVTVFLICPLVAFTQVPTDSLILNMPFSGNVDDVSGNDHDGIPFNLTATEDRFGNPNSAYSFNGVSSYIELPNVLPPLKGSWSYWFKTAGSSEGQILVYHSNVTDNGFGSAQSNAIEVHTGITTTQNSSFPDANAFIFDNSGESEGIFDTLNTVELDRWYNIIVTYDVQDSAKLYVNGDLVRKRDLSTEDADNTPTYTLIGKPTMDVRYFNGVFDDFRVYSKVLDETEVNSLYNENICFETITVYDTVSIMTYDTTFVTVYDSIAVTDTLIIEAVITGVDSPDNINEFRIYPNPAKTHIYINNGRYELLNDYAIRIEDISGRTVFSSMIDQEEFYIDLSEWSGSGIYFVHIFNESSVTIAVKKILIQE